MNDTDLLQESNMLLTATKVYSNNIILKYMSIIFASITSLLFVTFALVSFAINKNGFSVQVGNNGLSGSFTKEITSGIIVLSTDKEFSSPTSHLDCRGINNLTNISVLDIPIDVDNYDGEHNGNNYIAFSFYLKNIGLDCFIEDKLIINSVYKNIDKAIRVQVYKNGNMTQYAKAKDNGENEYKSISFYDNDTIYLDKYFLKQSDIVKYTVVIWLEGDDSDCDDSLFGGNITLSMEFNVEEE